MVSMNNIAWHQDIHNQYVARCCFATFYLKSDKINYLNPMITIHSGTLQLPQGQTEIHHLFVYVGNTPKIIMLNERDQVDSKSYTHR